MYLTSADSLVESQLPKRNFPLPFFLPTPRLQRVREEELSRDDGTAPASKVTAVPTTTTTIANAQLALSSATEETQTSSGIPTTNHSSQPVSTSYENPQSDDVHGGNGLSDVGGNLTDEEKAKFKAQAEKRKENGNDDETRRYRLPVSFPR